MNQQEWDAFTQFRRAHVQTAFRAVVEEKKKEAAACSEETVVGPTHEELTRWLAAEWQRVKLRGA
jgi:hypothetical protein